MLARLGALLTISFVQVFLFILYDDFDSALGLNLVESNTSVSGAGNSSQPVPVVDALEFGLAIFKAEFLPDEFDQILDEYWFGKVFLAAPPAAIVVLVLLNNCCARMTKTKIANDALSSELYSAGYFLWFYAMWLLLLEAKHSKDYFADYSLDNLGDDASSLDSVATVSYLTNCCAFLFMSFSIAVQEASGPTRSTDISKPMASKYFSSNLGAEGMLWLAAMWFNGTIAVVTTFVWTYQRESGTVWPLLVGTVVGLLYVCTYWAHVVWWYSHIHNRHGQVTDTLAAAQQGPVAPNSGCWRRFREHFSPEADGFYTKQALVEVAQLLPQSYRAALILIVGASGRHAAPSWHTWAVVAFAALVIVHGVSCFARMIGKAERASPYATLKSDLTFDLLYSWGGFGVLYMLWSQPSERGLPLCSAFPADWPSVVVTMCPLTLALWSLPTVIARCAIFMSDKKPAAGSLRRLFDHVDKDNSGLLDKEEIGDVCSRIGAKMNEKQLDAAFNKIDTDRSGEVSFEEFTAWMMQERLFSSKLHKAMVSFSAGGLAKAKDPPPLPDGVYKWFCVVCNAIAVLWAGFVIVHAFFMTDAETDKVQFVASMDQGGNVTTDQLFESTFEAFAARDIPVDATASFIVLDAFTSLRFEGLDIPRGATVTSATLSFAPFVSLDSSGQPATQQNYCNAADGEAICTSPTSIASGRLRVRGRTTPVDGDIAPQAQPGDGHATTAERAQDFSGLSEFTIRELGPVVQEIVNGASWENGGTMQLFLELVNDGGAVAVQKQSASCLEAEPTSSCYFPKQLLVADCKFPKLTIAYTDGDGVAEEVVAAPWPPRSMLDLF